MYKSICVIHRYSSFMRNLIRKSSVCHKKSLNETVPKQISQPTIKCLNKLAPNDQFIFLEQDEIKITYSRGRQSIQAYLVQGVVSLLRTMLKSVPLCVLKWELPGIYSIRKQEGFSLSTHISGDFGSE